MASIRVAAWRDGTRVYRVTFREHGRQRSKSFFERDEAELLVRLLDTHGTFDRAEQIVTRQRQGSPTVEAVTIDHVARLSGVEPGTIRSYESIIHNHLAGTDLGGLPVREVTDRDVLAWWRGLDRSDKTRRNIHALVSSALDRAVTDGLVERNPAKGVRGPRSPSKTRQPVFLTRDEVELIAESVGPYSVFVRFLAGTGLRYSEATALRWGDYHAGKVTVSRAWKRTAGTGQGQALGPPKTSKGNRSVTLPQALRDALTPGKRDALIFTHHHTGGRLLHGSFHKYYWAPALDHLGDQLHARPTIQDLRHTHASWLIAAGVPLPVIQVRMGHESIQTTSDVYGHLADDADQLAASVI